MVSAVRTLEVVSNTSHELDVAVVQIEASTIIRIVTTIREVVKIPNDSGLNSDSPSLTFTEVEQQVQTSLCNEVITASSVFFHELINRRVVDVVSVLIEKVAPATTEYTFKFESTWSARVTAEEVHEVQFTQNYQVVVVNNSLRVCPVKSCVILNCNTESRNNLLRQFSTCNTTHATEECTLLPSLVGAFHLMKSSSSSSNTTFYTKRPIVEELVAFIALRVCTKYHCTCCNQCK